MFAKIQLPENDAERKSSIIESLRSQELYGEILSEYSGKVFPTPQGLTNTLMRKYGFKDQAAQRITEILFQDLRANGLLNNSNVLSLNIQKGQNGSSKKEVEAVQEQSKNGSEEELKELIELNIPLKPNEDGKKRRAIIKLPEDYTDKDIDRVAKIVKAYILAEEDEKGTD